MYSNFWSIRMLKKGNEKERRERENTLQKTYGFKPRGMCLTQLRLKPLVPHPLSRKPQIANLPPRLERFLKHCMRGRIHFLVLKFVISQLLHKNSIATCHFFLEQTYTTLGDGINAGLAAGETCTWDLQVWVGVLYHYYKFHTLNSHVPLGTPQPYFYHILRQRIWG